MSIVLTGVALSNVSIFWLLQQASEGQADARAAGS